jgi:hypothetical protein
MHIPDGFVSTPVTKVIATHDLELVSAILPPSMITVRGQVAIDDKTERILADIPLLRAHGLTR